MWMCVCVYICIVVENFHQYDMMMRKWNEANKKNITRTTTIEKVEESLGQKKNKKHKIVAIKKQTNKTKNADCNENNQWEKSKSNERMEMKGKKIRFYS